MLAALAQIGQRGDLSIEVEKADVVRDMPKRRLGARQSVGRLLVAVEQVAIPIFPLRERAQINQLLLGVAGMPRPFVGRSRKSAPCRFPWALFVVG